jgi:hypothetical protein
VHERDFGEMQSLSRLIVPALFIKTHLTLYLRVKEERGKILIDHEVDENIKARKHNGPACI